MSLERVIKALISLGLTRTEAEIYVYISKKGPQKVVDLVGTLNYSKHEISTSLKNLIIKELINKDGISFSALPFEEALELLINREKEQANFMEKSKNELLVSWNSDF